MEAAELLIKLMDTIASPSAADVFKAIYQDPLLVQLLQDDQTVQRVCDVCGSDSSNWTPASICLAASNQDISLSDLRSLPLKPLDPEIRQQVSSLYQQVLLQEYQPQSAARCSLPCVSDAGKTTTDRYLEWAGERNFSQLQPTVVQKFCLEHSAWRFFMA